jgi:hypothetical protein
VIGPSLCCIHLVNTSPSRSSFGYLCHLHICCLCLIISSSTLPFLCSPREIIPEKAPEPLKVLSEAERFLLLPVVPGRR